MYSHVDYRSGERSIYGDKKLHEQSAWQSLTYFPMPWADVVEYHCICKFDLQGNHSWEINTLKWEVDSRGNTLWVSTHYCERTSVQKSPDH